MSSINNAARERQEKLNQLKINAAKAFMQEKREELARSILEAVNHQEAERLLQRLGDVKKPGTSAKSFPVGMFILIAMVSLFIGTALGFALGQTGRDNGAGELATDEQPIINQENQPAEEQDFDGQSLILPTLTENPELIASATAAVGTSSALDERISLTRTAAYEQATIQVGRTQTAEGGD